MAINPVIIERQVAADKGQIWQALTNPELMRKWYFDIPGFMPVPGHEFRFSGKDHDGKEWIHLCRVVEVIPGEKLSHTWAYEGYEGESMVTWTMKSLEDGTMVMLQHEGLENFPPHKSLARENFEAGWKEIVGVMLVRFLGESD